MQRFITTACAVLAALCLMFAASARASIVIGGTRVVFPAQQGEVTLRLSNEGGKPALVEAWIDEGNPNSTPDSVSTPFLITPPCSAWGRTRTRVCASSSPKAHNPWQPNVSRCSG